MSLTENWSSARPSIVMLDGATGTELAKRGLPPGVCPEAWCASHPSAIQGVQSAYEKAGSSIVYAPTFGGNRVKLGEFGLAGRVRELNRTLAEISRAGVRNALVFGDLAPTGKFVEPFGEFPFEEAVSVFREQAEALLEGGVQGFAIETMMDLQEARAALIGVREVSDLPVLVTMTFQEGGRTLTGNTPESALVALQSLGASAVGCNCSVGPEQMAKAVAAMKRYARVPIVAKPNAGMPRLVDGRTVFAMTPEEFGAKASRLVAAGASVVGGCCGTTPEHIACLTSAVAALEAPEVCRSGAPAVSSASRVLEVSQGRPFCVIGERLNPTGKKALQADLRAGTFELVRKYAVEQEQAGAGMLDVNCGLAGLSGAQQAAIIRQVVSILAVDSGMPLCIDTTSPEAAEAALRLYPGRALFNSISAEKDRLERVLPIAAKYGAVLIALPLDDSGIPPTVEGRADNVRKIFAEAEKYGYRRAELVIDGLVMTVSANPEAAETCLATIEWAAREWHACTVCGLSNVSFGLPRRDLINRAFLGMAIGRGLNMAIANPMNADIMDTARATDLLTSTDPGAAAFIALYASTKAPTSTTAGSIPAAVTATATAAPATPLEAAREAVVAGDVKRLESALDECLSQGMKPGELVDRALVPGITIVGDKYEKQDFFLPQLMAGARAMKAGMAKLAPLLTRTADSRASAGKIIIATVKGDIHDIGKNIVAMMLRNYNFEVIDLGKDVPAETILDTAVAQNVRLIALSALMTTTMGEMKNVIELARKRGMSGLNFMLGGAAVDESFAQSIGASYSRDAMGAVRLAQSLMSEINNSHTI